MELTSLVVSTGWPFYLFILILIHTGLRLKSWLKLHKIFCNNSFQRAVSLPAFLELPTAVKAPVEHRPNAKQVSATKKSA